MKTGARFGCGSTFGTRTLQIALVGLLLPELSDVRTSARFHPREGMPAPRFVYGIGTCHGRYYIASGVRALESGKRRKLLVYTLFFYKEYTL